MAETELDRERLRESQELVAAAAAEGMALRLLGGLAIAIHCGHSEDPHRGFSDLDAVAGHRDAKGLTALLEGRGYEADRRFNALNADSRLIFYGPVGKLDIFIDRFEMCHKIELGDRLEVDSPTLSVSDLLLTKLQVVEMNEKDLADLVLLIGDHEVAGGEGDHINADYLQRLFGRDWGLWKTAGNSVSRLRREAPQLGERLDDIERLADSAPRSLGFRLRGIVGERTKWYEEPEEVGDEA